MKKSETVNFHEGNGWNYQVTYNYEAQITYLKRYWTNGYVNDEQDQLTLLHIEPINSYDHAEKIWNKPENGYAFISDQEMAIRPQSETGAKTRINAIKKLQRFDEECQNLEFAERFSVALNNCKI